MGLSLYWCRPHARPRRGGGRGGSVVLVRPSDGSGLTLIELLVVLSGVGVLLAVVLPGLGVALDAFSVKRSADLAQGQMQRTRLMAVARRETLRLQVTPEFDLVVLDVRDSVLARTPLAGDGFLALDSVRLRPATLRYNARGHAAAGSLYLYRGHRGVRLVSNFVGRVRRERIRA